MAIETVYSTEILSNKTDLNSIKLNVDTVPLETQYSEMLTDKTKLNSIQLSTESIGLETQYSEILTTIENFFIVKDQNASKTFDVDKLEWVSISSNSKNITQKGITKMDNLIQNTTKSIKPEVKNETDSGKEFSKPMNFKSFKSISSISII